MGLGWSALAAADWPGFRGDGTSVTSARNLPLEWSASNNVAWRVATAGIGQSSPVIWRETVYVTSAVGGRKEELVVQALALATGRELWRFTTNSSVPEAVSDMRSQVAPTPVAGADGVFALFESGDCLALTHEGKLRWHRPLGKSFGEVASNHGLGGSPVLSDRLLLLPLDQSGPASLLALDRQDGSTAWSVPRADKVSWSTPVVVRGHGPAQVILSGAGTVTSYDAATGRVMWEFGGVVKNNVPSPSLAGDLLVIGAGGKGSNLALDLKPGTNAPVARWRAEDATSSFASPLVHQGRAYFLSQAGVLNAVEAQTGATLFNERPAEGAWASPVGAGERIYVFGQKGKTTVLEAAPVFRPLRTNELSLGVNITGVAVADGVFVIRAGTNLVCVGQPGGLAGAADGR